MAEQSPTSRSEQLAQTLNCTLNEVTANPDPEANSVSPVYKGKAQKVALAGNLTFPLTVTSSCLICKTEMITKYLPPSVAVRTK